MYVLGLSSRSLWPATLISAVSPFSLRFVENRPPCSAASKSTNQKPTLCRVAAYSEPGLPSPTISSIFVAISQDGAGPCTLAQIAWRAPALERLAREICASVQGPAPSLLMQRPPKGGLA